MTWRNFYQRYMRLINDYKNMGGRVTTGSDLGFIWQTWGFGYILELELLQEAGFSPLEVIQSATINGAKTLNEPKGVEPRFRPGPRRHARRSRHRARKPAAESEDALRHRLRAAQRTDQPQRNVGGVRWTIKDGIVYDAPTLLKSVRDQVAREKAAAAQN